LSQKRSPKDPKKVSESGEDFFDVHFGSFKIGMGASAPPTPSIYEIAKGVQEINKTLEKLKSKILARTNISLTNISLMQLP